MSPHKHAGFEYQWWTMNSIQHVLSVQCQQNWYDSVCCGYYAVLPRCLNLFNHLNIEQHHSFFSWKYRTSFHLVKEHSKALVKLSSWGLGGLDSCCQLLLCRLLSSINGRRKYRVLCRLLQELKLIVCHGLLLIFFPWENWCLYCRRYSLQSLKLCWQHSLLLLHIDTTLWLCLKLCPRVNSVRSNSSAADFVSNRKHNQ